MRLYHEKHGYKFTDGSDLDKLLKEGYVDAPYGEPAQPSTNANPYVEQIPSTSEAYSGEAWKDASKPIEPALTPVSTKFADDKRVKKAKQLIDKVVKAVKA